MDLQLLITDALRVAPKPLLRILAGKPPTIDGNTLDLNMHMIAKLSKQQVSRPGERVTVPQLRESAKAFNQLNLPIARGVTTEDTCLDLSGNSLSARIYRPTQLTGPTPAILFFHQGGLVIMDHLTDDHFCSLLSARCGATVISLGYRLCPENDFPAPIDDAKALWDYVQKNADQLRIDPDHVGLSGDSAGGLISSSLAILLRDQGGKQPSALCLAYPWVTTSNEQQPSLNSCAQTFPLSTATMHFFNEQVFPDDRHKNSSLANPLLTESLAHLPPTIIGTAGFDPIRDQGNAFADRLKEAGNTVIHYCFEDLTHSYLMFGRVSKAAEAACETLAKDMATLV